MKIFVTGATGFVGRYLVKYLLEAGHQVRCLVRDPSRSMDLKTWGAALCAGDLLSVTPEFLFDVDIVYHLAGNVYENTWLDLYRTNALGTKIVYESALLGRVKRFIYLSSIAAVGPTSKPVKINEHTIPKPRSKYGKSKLLGEQFIREIFPKGILETLIVRSPLVYGIGASQNSRMFAFIEKLKNGTFRWLNDGENIISMCYVEHLSAFLANLTSVPCPVTGKITLVHVCDDENPKFSSFIRLLCDILKVPFPTTRTSLFLARIFASKQDLVSYIFGHGNHLMNERITELIGNWNIDNTRAKQLGFVSQRTLRDCLMSTFSHREHSSLTSNRIVD